MEVPHQEDVSSQRLSSQKKAPVKLQNRRLGDKLDVSSPTGLSEAGEVDDSIIINLIAKRKEHLLRLALGALCHIHPDGIEEKGTAVADVLSKTLSTISTTVSHTSAASSVDNESSLGEVSLSEESTSHCRGHMDLTRIDVEVPRIGIDIGNVLLRAGKEVYGSCFAVRAIIRLFGDSNVFLVSRVRENSRMHLTSKEWLHGPDGFLERTGLPSENVWFVRDIDGPNGKGVVANHLALTHFVDDRWDVLKAVFADKSGNSGDLVQQYEGKLFHFALGWKPKHPEDMPSDLKPHYCAVSGWSEVLKVLGISASTESAAAEPEWMLKRQLHDNSESHRTAVHSQPAPAYETTGFVPASVSVHHVSVGIEEDVEFGVIKRLLGNNDENFKKISTSTGVKIVLNGKGSPHPQSQSLAKEPLTVCIRAKPRDDLQQAVEAVEALINDVRQEYEPLRIRAGTSKSHLAAAHSQPAPENTTTYFAPASVSVHYISVGIEEDVDFGVVQRLLGKQGEHFKKISSSTGVKIVLNGKGSPHPQPKSLADEPLKVCIRAKPKDDLQGAIELVEALLNDIRQDYHGYA
jgi:hypothetical protein